MQGFTSELTAEPTWMVDPVDGTTNFVHRFPFVCVAIGLAINHQVTSALPSLHHLHAVEFCSGLRL